MTTYNTGNPIGSADARDRYDNSENMDILENSTTLNAHPDRLGTMRKTRKGMELEHDNQIAAHEAEHDAQIAAHEVEHDNQMQSFENDFDSRLAGMAFTRVGAFTAGATLTDMRQTLEYNGHEYSWSGAFPKVVSAGSTPATSGGIGAGAWVDRSSETLRSDLGLVIKRFSSVAEMESDQTLVIGQVVETVSYHGGWNATTKLPKGGNKYEIVSGNFGVVDGGSVIQLSNGLRAKALFQDGIISIERFGAKGDGINDDHQSIQNAIDYCLQIIDGKQPASTVTMGVGRFLISKSIQLGYEGYRSINLIGSGSTTYPDSHFSGTYLICDFVNAPAINTQGLRQCIIERFCIIAKYIQSVNTTWPYRVENPYEIRCDESKYNNADFPPDAFSSTAPYAGICIDGYTREDGTVPSVAYPQLVYPYFVSKQTKTKHYGLDASSSIYINNVNILGFVVGVVTQPATPSANPQGRNGDFIYLNSCYITQCKYAVSTGHTDSRLMGANNSSFIGAYIALTNTKHGSMVGRLDGNFDNCCFDGCRYVFDLEGGRIGSPRITNAYGEQVVSLGKFTTLYNQSGDRLVIDSSTFRSVDNNRNGSSGPYLLATEAYSVKLSNSSFNNKSIVHLHGGISVENCIFGDEDFTSIPDNHALARSKARMVILSGVNGERNVTGFTRFTSSAVKSFGETERKGRSNTASIHAKKLQNTLYGISNTSDVNVNKVRSTFNTEITIESVNYYSIPIPGPIINMLKVGDPIVLTGYSSKVVVATYVDSISADVAFIKRLSCYYYNSSGVLTEIGSFINGELVICEPFFGSVYSPEYKITGTSTSGSNVITNVSCQYEISSMISVGDSIVSSDFDRFISGWNPTITAIDNTNKTITLSNAFTRSVSNYEINTLIKV